MKVVLLRVGIDSGCGGMQGPLFRDLTFEYVPIPDSEKLDARTYGTVLGRHGRALVDYFPQERRRAMAHHSMHFDPEFETFTYGDGTSPKRGLRALEPGDLLVFYCGLEQWGCDSSMPALYIMGYFEVQAAGFASTFSAKEINTLFAKNFHVMHRKFFNETKNQLLLVKGTSRSRLLKKAVLISAIGRDCKGRPLKVLSPQMRKIFGCFGGCNSVQRSTPRWVSASYVKRASQFVLSLR